MVRAAEAPKTSSPMLALDGRWYTDPAVFEREQAAIFARTWQMVCHQSQLLPPGAYATFAIGKVSLFVVRGRDETIRCFHNVCRHRAHELVEGQGCRPFIICPYHGWRYDLYGDLKSAPGDERVPSFDKSCIRLREVRTALFCGFVFVNLDPDAEPMAAWYLGVEDELRSFVPDLDDLKPVAEIPV